MRSNLLKNFLCVSHSSNYYVCPMLYPNTPRKTFLHYACQRIVVANKLDIPTFFLFLYFENPTFQRSPNLQVQLKIEGLQIRSNSSSKTTQPSISLSSPSVSGYSNPVVNPPSPSLFLDLGRPPAPCGVRAYLRGRDLQQWIRGLASMSLFGWLVADGWCWFVLREEYCWLVAGGWFVLREKHCWLVADKPSEQAAWSWRAAAGSSPCSLSCCTARHHPKQRESGTRRAATASMVAPLSCSLGRCGDRGCG
jgi:hypothetical protein